MQQNHMIAIGALAILGGLAWYQKKSAAAQVSSATQLGQQSNTNFAANLLNALTPTPTASSAKASAAGVVDRTPYVAVAAPVQAQAAPFSAPSTSAAPLNEFNIWQVAAKPVSVNTGSGGFSMVGS